MSAMPIQTPTRPYSPVSIGLHWLMLALLVAVYAVILLREGYPRGSDIREAFKAWHFSLGLTVFALVWLRVVLRAVGHHRAAGGWSDWIARAMHLALYAFMLVMPLLGWLTLSADGDPIRFFGVPLPALTAPNELLADRTKEIHETLGTVGYWLVGLHAAAALLHHYVFKDDTLKRMTFR